MRKFKVEPRGFTPAAPSVSGFRGAESRTESHSSTPLHPWLSGAWVKRGIILSLCLIAAGCAKKEAEPINKVQQEAPKAIQQKVLSFNLEGYSEKGDKKWEIQGDSAEAVQEDKVRLNNIVAKTFGDEAEATLSANKGLYDKSKNNVTLEENVKVTVANTEKLAGEYIDLPLVSISGEDNPNEEGKKKGLTTITCDGEVEFNYEENRAHFSRNVKVRSEGSDIDADKITVFLNVKTKKINEVLAEGNVKISRGENISYSDMATYIAAEKRIILSGRPKLVFYSEGDVENNF